jgi:hypothetical protein
VDLAEMLVCWACTMTANIPCKYNENVKEDNNDIEYIVNYYTFKTEFAKNT